MEPIEDRLSTERSPSCRIDETVYNDSIWKNKMVSDDYLTLRRRWRSRWDFAKSHVSDGSIVLDVGCGDGVLGELLITEKSCKVYGIDVSRIALNLAREKGLIGYLCDVSHDVFPFRDETFDAVIMTCILEHIAFPEHALEESVRVLKHRGLIIITIPNAANVRNRLELLLGRIPSELLHEKAGIHLRFWNYTDEFEKKILNNLEELTVIEKIATPKNPKASSRLKGSVLRGLIKASPNLFGEYTHFLIKKN
jgi:methionine biosynthesis protein MetW